MKTVYKYTLNGPGETTKFVFPESFYVVHVAMQDGIPRMWIELDPTEAASSYEFVMYGTGWDIDDEWQHVGTILDGIFVWHVYYRWKD